MGKHTHFLCAHDRIQPPLDIGLTPLSTTAVPMAMIYVVQIKKCLCCPVSQHTWVVIEC